MVALRIHHHCLVHGQLGSLPHRLQAGHARRVAGRPEQAVQDPVRTLQRLGRHDVLPAHGRHRDPLLRVSPTLPGLSGVGDEMGSDPAAAPRLCRIWKDMSLNDSLSEVERAKLAVWDYPVGDKYTKMWQAMLDAKMPNNLEEAVQRVRESVTTSEGFAYLGDATDIRYLSLTNCDLQMVRHTRHTAPHSVADLSDCLCTSAGGRGVLPQAVRHRGAAGLSAQGPVQQCHPAAAQQAQAREAQGALVVYQPRDQEVRQARRPAGRHLDPEHR